MSTIDDESVLDAFSPVLMIIGAGLISGVVIFITIAIAIGPILHGALLGPGANAAAQPAPASMELGDIITWIAVAFAAIGLPLSYVLPAQISRGMRRRIATENWTPPVGVNAPSGALSPGEPWTDTRKLALTYQTQFLIGAAINEGLAFFAGVAYLLGRNPIALGLALLLIATLALRFPTRNRLASWIERQQELLVQDRQGGY
jgi:hypothetical protein